MATTISTPAEVTTVEADPKRPVKAIVAIAIAVAVAVVQAVAAAYTDEVWNINDTIVVVLAGLGALGVYFAPNPIVKAEGRANGL